MSKDYLIKIIKDKNFSYVSAVWTLFILLETILEIIVINEQNSSVLLFTERNTIIFLKHLLIWLGGVLIILFLYTRLDRYVEKFREAEKKAKESEELLLTLINATPDIICFKDGKGRWLLANDADLQLFGLKGVDYFMKKDSELANFTKPIYKEAFLACEETDEIAFRKGELSRGVEIIPVSETEKRYYDIIKVPLFNNDGTRKGLVVIGRDITDEKNYEEIIKRQQEFLNVLLDSVPVGIFYKDVQGKYLGCNKKYQEMFGIGEKDLVGKTVFDVWDTESARKYHQMDIELINNPDSLQVYEYGKRSISGKFIEGMIYKSVFRDEKGNIAGIIGAFSDITQLKERERELKKLASVIQQLSDGVVLTDNEGKIQYVNPAFIKMKGIDEKEIIGKYVDELIEDDITIKNIDDIWFIIKKGDIWAGEVTNKRKDGTIYEEEIMIFPIKDDKNNIINYALITRDVTDKKIIQNRLNQSQKLEALGRLASGIAHDFNNMLAVIQGNIELAQLKIGTLVDVKKNFTNIYNVIERGTQLIKQLLVFARDQKSNFANININHIVLETASILKSLIGENINIILNLSSDIKMIKADSINIQQLILNLCINSRDAMPDGGKITISTSNITIDESDIRFLRTGRSGEYVQLSVEDTGIGMDKETLSKIFEPFFTTKDIGKGTGLGLYVVYWIVERHEAIIEVDSKPNQGTVFRIFFPAVKEIKEDISHQKSVTKKPSNPSDKTILVVEDEAQVRDVVVQILKSTGYNTFEADSYATALEIFHAEKDRIDLILSDFMLTDKTGLDLAKKCRSIKSNVKIVLMTGYIDLGEKFPEIKNLGCEIFFKPFKADKLTDFISDILAE